MASLLQTFVRSQYRYAIVGAVITVFLLFNVRPNSSKSTYGTATNVQGGTLSPREHAANRTLGFEKLLAISDGRRWRVNGLQAAANLTGIDFTIPTQPQNPDEFIKAFEKMGKEKDVKPKHGSAIAWVAHLDMLKYFILSGWSTALIVEDDADWDTDILNQMQLVSDNVRAFTNTSSSNTDPYGRAWDVLWLGHCGSAVDKETRSLTYLDPTRCPTEQYSGWSKHYLKEKVPSEHRQIQDTRLTVCTFGYAVRKHSAPKVLAQLGRGAEEAFDVSLSKHCRAGKLNCVVVNPQIMNHYEPPKDHGYASGVKEGNDGGAASAMRDAYYEQTMGTTGNVVRSARCLALFGSTCMRPPSEM